MSPCLWSAWWTLITRTADMAFNRCSHLCFGSFTVRCLPRTFFDFCLIQFPQVVNLGGGVPPTTSTCYTTSGEFKWREVDQLLFLAFSL